MIKFGSRTELYLPAQTTAKFLVKKGDKVKAGTTILAKYDKQTNKPERNVKQLAKEG
jgi:hypothetical protein